MEKPTKSDTNSPPDKLNVEENIASASKPRSRGRKRKRQESDSSLEDALPENALEVEKNLQQAAQKNNLDDVSVKKILKKVVTNDHVLALVKLREEEEIALEQNPKPKLTRAKAKELMKVSPKSAPWNLELTPIKHIPVKTRPEVEALINKELPEDEDDDEYKPTNDDVPSDDDQTLESCSDVDSQPATPGTPSARRLASPRPVTDGPFKVPPPSVSLSARRKLVVEGEEATIALRTRSKLSLSATPIEHIESSFVPPDDVPVPIGDSLWNQFLEQCLNPAEGAGEGEGEPPGRHEDDDDADPEYNAAADPDANDEEEDINGLLRISKKELNDLVTELFSIMPSDEQLAHNHAIPSATWEGKQEPISDEEIEKQAQNHNLTEQQKRNNNRFSIGKSEPADDNNASSQSNENKENHENMAIVLPKVTPVRAPRTVNVLIEEQPLSVAPGEAGGEGGARAEPPPALQAAQTEPPPLTVHLDNTVKILPEQVLVLQQQVRQHVQLAAGNFLQLFVNPAHWTMAPAYKHYLEQLYKMVEANPSSVANVCNLKPAVELVRTWEETVAENTPANKQLVEFIQKEAERSRRRYSQNSLYVGNFPEMFMEVIANSTVFQYPYLLPAMPYRADYNRKFGYKLPEDELIALGLDQFWQYIEDNPELYKKPRAHSAGRWGLAAACALVVKHMMPWTSSNWLMRHIMRTRKLKDNPIAKFFASREVKRVEHRLLPFNPALTLYEQPEHEMPKIWVRYLAKSSKRFKYYYYRRSGTGVAPQGVPVTVSVEEPIKAPLPPDFTKTIVCHRQNLKPVQTHVPQDKFDLVLAPPPMLTIHPLSTNTGGVISGKPPPLEINKREVPKGKVAIPNLRAKKTSGLKTENPTNNNLPKNFSEVNKTGQNNYSLVPNMYSLVNTSAGPYLVPLAVLQNTNTVSSIKKPISSSIADKNECSDNLVQFNTLNKQSIKIDENGHCECCVLLRKICKLKQSRITDYFSKNKTEKRCECMHRKFPKVTKRLRMLIDNFKSRSWCEQMRIQEMIKSAERGVKTEDCREARTEDDEKCTIEDIEYVTTFHMKLTRRSALVRNAYIKSKVQNLFSYFDPEEGDPIMLSKHLFQALGIELVDLYKEFMGFLTPQQAEKIDRFKDYFVHSCVRDLLRRIESEVTEKESRKAILSQLSSIFSDNTSPSCALCSSLLLTLGRQPRLATHVFSLFPHRTVKNSDRLDIHSSTIESPPSPSTDNQDTDCVSNEEPASNQDAEPEASMANTMPEPADRSTCEDTLVVMDCDDNCSSDEDNEEKQWKIAIPEESESHIETMQETGNIKNENPATQDEEKTGSHDSSTSTVMSQLVMSEDEQEVQIKTEPPEWLREEDIIIISLVSKYLTPEQKKDKTVLETLEENRVYQQISEELPHKHIDDIRERVMKIVDIIVLNNS